MIYGLKKLIKRGCTICLYTTYRCNLKCSYCINHLLVGSDVNIGQFISEERTPEEWYKLIKNFPVPIKEVILSGGEPTMYENIDMLTFLLLRTGINIVMYTNMTNRIDLTRSSRFRIQATLHKSVDEKSFYDNVEWYRKKHVVHVERFGNEAKKGCRTIKTTKKDIDICRNLKRFKFSPDGMLWINDNELSDTYYKRVA